MLKLALATTAISMCVRRGVGAKKKKQQKMDPFDDISGIPALRPSKSDRAVSLDPKTPRLRHPVGGANTNANASANASAKKIKTILLVLHGVKSKERKGERQVNNVRARALLQDIALIEVVTERAGHCEELVRDASLRGVDAVGVMGGDGSLREGVCGMLARPASDRRPVFVFPVGTGNNFARDLGHRDVKDAFDAIGRGVERAVDVVKVTHPGGGTYSVNCVTWGMARDAAETAEKMRWMGPVRYDVAGFYHIAKGKANLAKITASDDGAGGGDAAAAAGKGGGEGDGAYDDYMMMFAQNTRCSGRNFKFTPSAELDDGKFDVVAVRKCGMFKTIGLFDKVKADGAHVEDPDVCYVKATRATLDAKDASDLVGIDGEVNVKSPVTLEAIKHAFTTLVLRVSRGTFVERKNNLLS